MYYLPTRVNGADCSIQIVNHTTSLCSSSVLNNVLPHQTFSTFSLTAIKHDPGNTLAPI